MKRKFNFVLLVFLLIFSISTIIVNAADLSFTTTMTPSSTSVSDGAEVVVTVSISNLNVGDSGINAFSAYLSYDSDVFEALTDSSVEGLNNWATTYSATSGQILLTKNSFVNSDEDIMQITLKTKEGLEAGTEGTVSLTGILVSNSEDQVSGSNVSTTITVGEGTETEGNTTNTTNVIQIEPSTNNTNTGNTDNTNNNANTNNSSNNAANSVYNIGSNNNNTPEDKDIPYTGVSGDAFIKIILGVIFIALVIYIKIRKMDELK